MDPNINNNLMLISGLVTLNIHEALTFEGTEICLHPDLFQSAAAMGGQGEGTSGAHIQSGNSNKEPRLLSINSAVSMDDGKPSILASASGSTVSMQQQQVQQKVLLQSGDMIEIRVWDPLPNGTTTSASNTATAPIASNAASVMRKRPLSSLSFPLPTVLSMQGSSSFAAPQQQAPQNGLTGENLSKNVDVSEDPAGNKDVDSSTVSSGERDAASIQPEITPQPSPKQVLSPNQQIDTSPNSTKTTVTSLPPVFPKPRNQLPEAGKPPKPPLLSDGTMPGVAYKPRQPYVPVKSRHMRDLSDMTVDSVAYAGSVATTLDSSHQLVDLQLPFSQANAGGGNQFFNAGGIVTNATVTNDDDDDAWTHISNTHELRLSFVMMVTEQSLTSLKSSARTQISILRQVADLYQLSSYDMVTIHKIKKEEEEAVLANVSADYVVITIKDQFISRGDLHNFQESLIGSWIYRDQRLHEAIRGVQGRAQEIRHGDQQARSGIVTKKTTVAFRSRSSRIIWLVQVSHEMWEYTSPYDENGQDEGINEIYFDRFITFVNQLFLKWKQMEATHSLTVVFFSRTFVISSSHSGSKSFQKDFYGRSYEDHFRLVIENQTVVDWNTLVIRMKEAFMKYPEETKWNLSLAEGGRRPSNASQGNVLEAINVTLNLLQFHYLDRDLHRTGNSVVVITAGNGVFEVDKGLASITYQRMMDNGIGSDMLSLSLPPLHIAPFFLYTSNFHSVDTDGVDMTESYYEVPHWMHLSFATYESDVAVGGRGRKPELPLRDDLKIVEHPAGFSLAPNGFILRREDIGKTTPTGPCPLVHMASSVSNKAINGSSDRKLISGRDFRDILEACRPRNGVSMPSALRSLLGLRTTTFDVEHKSKGNGNHSHLLKEWGSIDLAMTASDGERSPRKATGFVRGIDRSVTSTQAHSAGTFSSEDALEKSSPSASFAAQLTNILGSSYERQLFALSSRAIPSAHGMQLQRVRSLEVAWPQQEDTSSVLIELPAFGTDTKEGANNRLLTERRLTNDEDTLLDSLRRMMKAHDSGLIPQASPKMSSSSDHVRSAFLDMNSLSSLNVNRPSGINLLARSSNVDSGHATTPSDGKTLTGIDAALSNYRNLPPDGMTSTTGLTSTDTPGPVQRLSSRLLSETSAGLRQSHAVLQGLSPLLLPPVAMRPLSNDNSGFGDEVNDRRMIEHSVEVSHHSARGVFPSEPSRDKFAGLSTTPYSTGYSSRLLNPKASRQNTHSLKSAAGSRRKKAFNPFRQQDEDEVLARKSHNRRRWSHVFPLGEVEFKRHAGPNWRSLTLPAILPLYVDYFPPQHEIDRGFTFNSYNVILSEFDSESSEALFQSNEDLLMEMVRLRLTQDYQLVPAHQIDASKYRTGSLRDSLIHNASSAKEKDEPGIKHGLKRQFLSMGHRLQVLTYDAAQDIIEVVQYNAKSANETSTLRYQYRCYCEERGEYTTSSVSFAKFGMQYKWNAVDSIISSIDSNRALSEDMRFRRVMFCLIPERFKNEAAENEYIAKFKRFLEYLNKLRTAKDMKDPLRIRIVSSKDSGPRAPDENESIPGIERNAMVSFYVQLRKGGKRLEWMEVVVDSTFNTAWSYRLMFHWLVASSSKVDAQVQVLQRRCSQFGLNLVPIPQITVSRDIFLNPFKAPAMFTIKDKGKAALIPDALAAIDFIHDGVFFTDAKLVSDGLEDGTEFDFKRNLTGRQLIHRSGTILVRLLFDKRGWLVAVTLGNYRYQGKDEALKATAKRVYQDLARCFSQVEAGES